LAKDDLGRRVGRGAGEGCGDVGVTAGDPRDPARVREEIPVPSQRDVQRGPGRAPSHLLRESRELVGRALTECTEDVEDAPPERRVLWADERERSPERSLGLRREHDRLRSGNAAIPQRPLDFAARKRADADRLATRPHRGQELARPRRHQQHHARARWLLERLQQRVLSLLVQ
jgi:hypothetical protein